MKKLSENEGNALIAEFMDVETIKMKGAIKWKSKHDGVKNLLYHISWDWLMPVLEKLENDRDVHFQIEQCECFIWDELEYHETASEDTTIESTWKAVVAYLTYTFKPKNPMFLTPKPKEI